MGTDQGREIRLTGGEADELLDVLETVVVSLDRMGSREASGEDPEHRWIHEYFSTGGATRRLARARGLLLEAFRRVYTEDELEDRWDARPVAYWSPPLPGAALKTNGR